MSARSSAGERLFAPFEPGFREDPYPHYRRLREQDPVHRTDYGFWLVTRYDDVVALLHDPSVTSHGSGRLAGERPAGGVAQVQDAWLLSKEPPEHTYVRRLLNAGFTPRAIRPLREHVSSYARELLEPCLEARRFDVTRDFAYPLATDVICELVGVPTADRDLVRDWVMDMFKVVHAGGFGMGAELPEPEDVAAARTALRAFHEYVVDLIAARRRDPADDIIGLMVAAQKRDGRLEDHEIVANALAVFAAGHDTTIGLVGNALIALHRNPEALARVRAEGLSPGAVAELLRYDAPVQSVPRKAAGDLHYGGRTIEAGSNVIVVLASANRDPDRFPDPDRLDLDRRGERSLSFGLGVHYCLGAPLGRVEAELALGLLLDSTRGSEIDEGGIEWRESLEFRGPDALPLELTPA